MGIRVIKLPDVGEGIAEAELVEWHVEVGQSVLEDQLLASVMTDKATVEIPSPVAGIVVAVGAELVRLEVAGAGEQEAAAVPRQAPSPTPAVEPPAASPMPAKPRSPAP